MYENERRLITAMQNESQKFHKALDMIIRVRLHHEKLPIGINHFLSFIIAYK
ncbi:hypothetical protein ACQKIC_02130 [Peribacillus sp. NPDC046944]|uniref:hypothetical protein n=1 Tax=unclassified Peribacillus TaxID=2675266 RepID=UPI003D07FF04